MTSDSRRDLKGSIGHYRLPIVNCLLRTPSAKGKGFEALRTLLFNRQSKIGNKKVPRQAARDFKVFEVVSGSMSPFPSCLAGYFTWPQVALTHHVFHRCLYAI